MFVSRKITIFFRLIFRPPCVYSAFSNRPSQESSVGQCVTISRMIRCPCDTTMVAIMVIAHHIVVIIRCFGLMANLRC